MKIRIVSSRSEIESVKNEKFVHIAFRPSNTDILNLAKGCPELSAIQIPTSYLTTVSRSTRMFLEMQGIDLVQGDVWGHRKDINEYSEVSQSVYDQIRDYREQGLSEDEIKNKLVENTKLSSDLIQFIIKK